MELKVHTCRQPNEVCDFINSLEGKAEVVQIVVRNLKMYVFYTVKDSKKKKDSE